MQVARSRYPRLEPAPRRHGASARTIRAIRKAAASASLAAASFLCGEVAGEEPEGLRAGAAAVDVTPQQFPINMPGGFGENLAQSAHDPLHARALVLANGETTVAIVVVDNLGVARETVDEAKELAAERCGIPIDRMFVSSTHTHSGPPANVTEGEASAVAYRPLLVKGIADAISQAHARLRPAEVGAAVEPLAEEVFNRRWFVKPGVMNPNPFGGTDLVKMNPGTDPEGLLAPAGPTDPAVTALAIDDAQTHKPLALYANYSLHYVGGIPASQVSADYFGEFARLTPSRLGAGEGFVAMLSNGASGDINNIPFGVGRAPREPFEQVRLVAMKTADAAWRANETIGPGDANATVDMIERVVTLKRRKPSAEEIARANAILAITDQAEKAKLPRLADVYAERTLAMADGPETIDAKVQAIRIGDVAICGLPFETFCEIGLEVKRKSPFETTIFVGLANGYEGYLPTPEQHKLGGYETWLGTNRVQLDASVLLTEALTEMLGELAARRESSPQARDQSQSTIER